MNNADIIVQQNNKQKVRILRPWEAKALDNAIPKYEYQMIFEALLYSGMRYVELERFQKYPEWFNGDFIHLPSQLASRKAKRKQKERWVRLNPAGKKVIRSFLNVDKKLPSYKDWTDDLCRWAKYANIDFTALGPKTTRKSWESWLVFTYENKTLQIFQSQGHTQMTALQHYLNMPFTDNDKLQMKEFVDGWI